MLSQRNVIATRPITAAYRRLEALLATPIKRAVARIRAADRLCRARGEASVLDDRLLADIGLSRAQIWSADHAAHETAREPADSRWSRRQVARLGCDRMSS